MSQVKNLRAMFESKGETSPPDRGRSPGATSTAGTDSPRRLSQVRTNFIAIEKDGRIGLQRTMSGESAASGRKFSTGTESETPPASYDRPSFLSTKSDLDARKNLVYEPIPESPRQDASPTLAKSMSASMEARTAKPEKKAEADAPAAKPVASNARSKPSTNGSASVVQNDGPGEQQSKTPGSTRTVKKKPSKETAKAAEVTNPRTNLAPVTTASKTATKPPKSPLAAKTPTAVTKPPAQLKAKAPEKEVPQPSKRSAVDEPKASTRTNSATAATTSSTAKPAPLAFPPNGIGFVKPKPKSPTRPVRLPAGLMTHTASSVSKVNASRQSLSRASGSYAAAQTLGRSPSRTSVSTVGTAAGAAGTKTLKRQSSVVNRSRPSIGPPPPQPAKDYPLTKREREVDEDFLARMMRPTQSSSSKTHERPDATPPRKTSAPAKKPVARHPPKSDSERAVAPIRKAESSAAKDIAPVVEQMASAEKAVEVAKEAEGTVELPPANGKTVHPTTEIEAANTESAVGEAGGLIFASQEEHTQDESEVDVGDESTEEPGLVNGGHGSSEQEGEPSVEGEPEQVESEPPANATETDKHEVLEPHSPEHATHNNEAPHSDELHEAVENKEESAEVD